VTRRRRVALAVLAAVALAGAGAAAYWHRPPRRGLAGPYRPRPVSDLPGPWFRINAHEHIERRRDAPKLLRVMDELSIEATVLAAGSKVTTVHKTRYGFEGYDENSQEVLDIARQWPGRFIPFVTVKPGDPDNDKKLARWVERGARGVKLYTGHSLFHTLLEPDRVTRTEYLLDDPSLMPMFAWAEEHELPVLWHVNTGTYLAEFQRVMDAHPNLLVICPHHCMAAGRPEQVAGLMRTYPRLWIDLSHGYHEYMAQALQTLSRRRAEWRPVYEEFSERLVWGTDVVITPKREKSVAWIEEMAGAYFGLFGDAEFSLPIYDKTYKKQKTERLPGMALPDWLQCRIYQDNPHRLFGLKHDHHGPPRP
jgi:predicted TIM-barrel fold metal-dependent hydrolase